MFTLLTALAAPALMPPADLQALVEGFAAAPAVVDPRLILPVCLAPALAWAGAGSVEVRCAAPAWRIFIAVGRGATPVATATSAPPPMPTAREAPVIRRGDRVVVEAAGPGFSVALETTAVADAREGRVPLRSAAGRALTGLIGPDGRVRLTGLNSGSAGR